MVKFDGWRGVPRLGSASLGMPSEVEARQAPPKEDTTFNWRRLTRHDAHAKVWCSMQVRRVLINLAYPPACLLCHSRLPRVPAAGSSEQAGRSALSRWEIVCATCERTAPRNGPPICRRCGVGLRGAFDAVLTCAACEEQAPAFDIARAPWAYAGTTQETIRQFKYHRHWRIGHWLGESMAEMARHNLPLSQISLVLPVPMHWLKHRLRGFNPAEQLAITVAQSLAKPCARRALRRRRWTRSQTALPLQERFPNVQAAFGATPRDVRGHRVLLIDDVLTSGATAQACALALRRAGARSVFVLTAARTPRG